MVLDATFSKERRDCRFSQVLIDGGSSINILYHDTLEKLSIKEKQLQPSRTVFHGIVSGLSYSPIGKIKIDILFGDRHHSRRHISFTKGIIIIAGDYQKLAAYAAASSRLAESLVIAAEKRLLDQVVAMDSKQLDLSPDPKEPEAQGSFQPTKGTKKIPLDPEHSERFAVVGAHLDSK
ncbi:uncharacterized protein [Aegilops tauschii subsp. strangulata]|uniref:uncharacterized protein n=1 Tax=Aegilops tauschii subsp. strangulata TaxID=200361 RepID=UPI001E1CA7B7|nr:uncharacterized protein LOC123493982 [Aegilops tauschii subsp. strangulata]